MSISEICTNFVWKPGDWLIHEKYGIGRYVGTDIVMANDVSYECVGMEHGAGRVVWTPTALLSTIGYYADSSKQIKVRKNVRQLNQLRQDARQWVDAFIAQMQTRENIRVPPMSIIPLLHPHESLTLDQKNCLEDIAADLTSGKLMDRLVCGDVCTGKTEIAIQTIRIALHNGGQVVLLAPTTVLAQQHFNTLSARLSQYNVQLATRVNTGNPKTLQSIMDDCASGKIDVLVSTHSVVRNSRWSWKSLKLAIVDEEHCFGTEDKEKAKFVDVHCLFMTATPLPKTTHMVLKCGKKISTLKQLPGNRVMAETHIVSEVDVASLVKPYGQVLCICKRIGGIPDVKQLVEEQLVARGVKAQIFVTHGKMPLEQINATLEEALRTPGSILISTALVGVGIDKESLHTLVVFDEDWGLLQLHQLRGRVSRGAEQGGAYFVSPEATRPQRIKLLKTYSQPGSGWVLAQKDMELRGAGAVVGTKQSGHSAELGMDTMLSIVREAEGLSTVIDVPQFRYLIPASYIHNPEDRIYWYRQLSQATSLLELHRTRERMQHQYGLAPKEMNDLWDFYNLKVYACSIGVKQIRMHGREKIAIGLYNSDETHILQGINTLRKLRSALESLCGEEERKVAS